VRISKPVALLIGLVTLVPVIYIFVFLASVFVGVGGDKGAIPVFGTLERMMMFHVSVMLLGFRTPGFLHFTGKPRIARLPLKLMIRYPTRQVW
jgi:hypothetical protein